MFPKDRSGVGVYWEGWGCWPTVGTSHCLNMNDMNGRILDGLVYNPLQLFVSTQWNRSVTTPPGGGEAEGGDKGWSQNHQGGEGRKLFGGEGGGGEYNGDHQNSCSLRINEVVWVLRVGD